jgi:hypothetical protein
MKKLLSLFLGVGIVLLLAACGGGSEEAPTEVVDSETVLSGQFGETEMPVQMQLMIGTFMLEDTDLEVTAQQAPELITLWKALQALSTSDTTAEEEIDAVIRQIQDAMTPEQLNAIQEMELTPESIATLMEELDLQPGAGFTGADGERFQGQELPEGFPRGEFPPGRMPEGGVFVGPGPGGQNFGEDLNPEQMATLEAMREERGGFRNRVSLFLIDPLIQYLEGKME